VTPDEILALLDAQADPDPARVLDALLAASRAERGFLVLREDGELQVRVARNMDGEEVRRAGSKVSRTLLERALAEGRPVVATDADVASVESLAGQKVRSVCALPLRACDGAVYLDHRAERGLFSDLALLGEFSSRLDRALRAAQAGDGPLVGRSKPMQELFRVLDRVARAPYAVLVTGESGTGKELVARSIHAKSPRAKGPFVAANCASFPESLVDGELFGHSKGAFTGAAGDRAGLFEQADGGTLFLDEIATLPRGAQESLLRVLEAGEVRRLGGSTVPVDVRVVAATNEDLELAEHFRRDLLYRLNVLRIELPALRDRGEDLPLLAERLLDRVAAETGRPRARLAPDALRVLESHRWPGNVRELLNALRRAAALSESDVLGASDFAFLRVIAPADEAALLSVDDYLRESLVRWSGRMELGELAAKLGVSRKTLWEKKKRWGL
jgi:DNA-binding NtrC family response regulator